MTLIVSTGLMVGDVTRGVITPSTPESVRQAVEDRLAEWRTAAENAQAQMRKHEENAADARDRLMWAKQAIRDHEAWLEATKP
jgi:hypothetical protein